MSTSPVSRPARRGIWGMMLGRTGGVPTARVAQVLAPAGTLAASVLAAAPVGLAWGASAPRVQVELVDGSADLVGATLVELYGDARIAADARFLAAVVVAGLVGGVLACLLGRRHGPAVVLALAAGGLLAAYVAMRVGTQVGVVDAATRLRQARAGPVAAPLELGARTALVGWPVGSLVGYLLVSLLTSRGDDQTNVASSG